MDFELYDVFWTVGPFSDKELARKYADELLADHDREYFAG